MFKTFLDKLIESFKSVLPISIVILIISVLIGVPLNTILYFLLGALMLVVGLALFQLGAFESTGYIAQDIGKFIVRKKSLLIFIVVAFLVGLLITIAEPALWVMGDQLKKVIAEPVLIGTVSIGVGIFVAVGLLRILFGIKLRTLFVVLYVATFIIGMIVSIRNPEFIPLAFDSGGVTTGPMAVPFIMGLALGVSKNRGDRSGEFDSFGLVGIASIGPILAVSILGLFYKVDPSVIGETLSVVEYFKQYLIQMAIAISPFVLFFVVFNLLDFKYSKRRVIKILIAFIYTYIGLVLFLTGANAGFAGIGKYIGEYFSNTDYNWIIILLGFIFGLFVVAAEPSVITLNQQVEDVTAGTVSKRLMMFGLATGVSVAVALAMVRVLTGISIWWFLIPGYLITIILTFFTPQQFYSISFDSGGAVSGAMTSAFLMPFALGAASAISGANILTDAFGLVAFVAMSPLITIQLIGLVYKRKTRDDRVITGVDDIMDL